MSKAVENRFEEKVVLLTGAASGIGRETALRLASEGASLFCLDLNEEKLAKLAQELEAAGTAVGTQLCDVSDEDQVEAAVSACRERFGRIDSLCNVAGILRFDNTHELKLADWNKVLSVNLTGTFLMCRAAIPHLIESKGNIVNVASTAAIKGQPWTAAYSASKGGVLALTYNLAVDYGAKGVRVNAVCPGGVVTPIVDNFRIPEGADPKLINRVNPPGGLGDPKAIASIIALLASDDAAHMNGSYVRADGGTHS